MSGTAKMSGSDPAVCRILCRVQPRASRNAVAGRIDGAWKIALTAPPVEGRANAALVEFFSRLLDVPKRAVAVASGEHSRNKTVVIEGVTEEYVNEVLAIGKGGK